MVCSLDKCQEDNGVVTGTIENLRLQLESQFILETSCKIKPTFAKHINALKLSTTFFVSSCLEASKCDRYKSRTRQQSLGIFLRQV